MTSKNKIPPGTEMAYNQAYGRGELGYDHKVSKVVIIDMKPKLKLLAKWSGYGPVTDLLPIKKSESQAAWGNYDFKKNSLAVLAVGPSGDGYVLWSVGGHIGVVVEEEACSRQLSEIGLDGFKPGIWVWEGRYYAWETNDENGHDYDAELRGDIRKPTETELKAILDGECPWNDDDWKLPGK